jgi:SPP1 gp7 family putative phage head morphogenesis protein
VSSFKPKTRVERELARQLMKIAERSGDILSQYIRRLPDGSVEITDIAALSAALVRYAKQLEPWAIETATKAIQQVSAQNLAAWKATGVAIGLSDSLVKRAAAALLREQVDLIKSIPTRMAERAQSLALEAQKTGARASVIAAEIENSTKVAQSRAVLIARTEIAKANATLTQARAQSVGATHYVWRTAGDSDVRETHAELDGKVFAFDDPPYIDGEGNHHAGEFPNCRCYAEPILTNNT